MAGRRMWTMVRSATPGVERGVTTADPDRDALAAAQRRIAAAAEQGDLDQARAPLLEALEAYHQCEPASFSIPAHKAGRSLDERTRAVLGGWVRGGIGGTT
jgi:hypothetical protein